MDEQAVERIEEAVARRAVHRPVVAQPLAAAEDLFGDDIEVRSAPGRRVAPPRLQRFEIRRGIEQTVGMIDARPVTSPCSIRSSSSACVAANTRGSSMRRPARSLTSKKRR